MRGMMIMCLFSPENIEIKPEHIKCSETCNSIFDCKQELVMMESCSQYFILTEES